MMWLPQPTTLTELVATTVDGCGEMLRAAAACRLRLRRDSLSILEVLRAATARPLPFAQRVVECAVSNPDVWDSLVLYLVLRRDFG